MRGTFEGATRASVFELGEEMGIPIEVRDIPVDGGETAGMRNPRQLD